MRRKVKIDNGGEGIRASSGSIGYVHGHMDAWKGGGVTELQPPYTIPYSISLPSKGTPLRLYSLGKMALHVL